MCLTKWRKFDKRTCMYACIYLCFAEKHYFIPEARKTSLDIYLI